jgi:hypothetical protein
MTTVPSILTATSRRNRLAIPFRWAVLLAVGAWTHVDAAAAAAPEADPLAAVLDLHDEGFIAGTFADGPAAGDKPQGAIVWRSPAFADPFAFPLDAIRGIRFPRPTGDPPAGGGDWRVELAGGDALVGSIESRDDSAVVMAIGSAATPIRISVRRDSIRHMDRVMDRDGESDSYTGPTGLEGWRVSPPNAWRQDAATLTGTAASTLVRTIRCGPRCRYDLSLSWKEQPSVQVMLGDRTAGRSWPYQIELGPTGMVALRQEGVAKDGAPPRADLEPFGDLPKTGLTMTVFVDQQTGRMAVMLPGIAEPVADLTVAPVTRTPGDVFRIALQKGSLTLESLRVSTWRTADPALEENPQGQAPRPVVAGDARAMPSVQVVDAWGSRLSGELERVTSEAIVISHPAIAGEASLPIATLATLTSLRPRQEPSELPGRMGRLDYESGTMLGCLAAAPPASAGAAIAWQPAGSLTASPFTLPADGQPQATITYAKPPGESRPQLPQRGRKQQLSQQASQADDRQPPPEPAQVDQTAPDWFGSRLILRTGETLLCRVESIDEQSVRVRVPGGEAVPVAGEWVQALELVPAGGRPLTSEKFRSLTTLPRSQRQQPPTHVLRSVQGDYLRGRLVSMDESTVRMAVDAGPRDKPVNLSRGDVARLIWLHPENIATPWQPPQPIAAQGLLVDATVSATEHLRLVATGIDGNVIRGVNPAIGPCRIDLENVRVLFLGGRRDDLPQTSPYSQWRLTLAADPRNLPPGSRTPAAPDALDPDATAATDQPATEPQRVSPGADSRAAADLLVEADRLASERDRRAVAAYATLLSADDRDVRSRSIAQLRRITAAGLPYGIDDAVARRETQATAWRRWAARNAVSVDLRFPDRKEASWGPPPLGRLLVCRPGSNDVVEYDDNGVETFRVAVPSPWACDGTPDGHRLIGSYGGKYIVEFDETGKEISRIANLESGVMSLRRLENGHTLATLADANKVVEFDPEGKVTWEARLAGRPCDARRLPDGRTLVALHKANRIVEVDEEGSEVWAVENLPDPQAVQRLPNGNTLVALTVPGIVREIDQAGNEVWSREGFAVLVDAQRLPDGRTLLLEQNGTRIELDADGNEVSRTDGVSSSRLLAY